MRSYVPYVVAFILAVIIISMGTMFVRASEQELQRQVPAMSNGSGETNMGVELSVEDHWKYDLAQLLSAFAWLLAPAVLFTCLAAAFLVDWLRS